MVEQIQKLHAGLAKVYGSDKDVIQHQIKRYEKLYTLFSEQFDEKDLHFFSTPGRTEIGGNHTDHNHGRVLAGSVNIDSIAVAAKNDTDQIKMFSDGYAEPFIVNLIDLVVNEAEKGTTFSLIRGIASRFKQLGLHIGGFNAYVSSDVLPGSGLSSSASIEVLIGTFLNYLYNDDKVTAEQIAIIGKYAENVYFGKPSGLMDQVACAYGGIVTIDFENTEAPVIKKVNFDFETTDYNLVIVDTGGNHADLTDDYASIPIEMKKVAQFFNGEVCRDLNIEQVISRMGELRGNVGDRAVLRAMHFLQENDRVVEQVAALEKNDFSQFLDLVNASGSSSFKWLQNSYTTKNTAEQGISVALALTEFFLRNKDKAACRVHGGGFAGTIQVFMPNKYMQDYKNLIQSVFGKDSVMVLSIRSHGTVHLNSLMDGYV